MKKPILVKTDLDKKIRLLVDKIDKKILVVWACDCARRVLPYFEKKYSNDQRPRLAIKAGRAWVRTGIFKMADVRKISLAAHAAARRAKEYSSARSAARSAGQAAAAAHVKEHSIAAAIYAATAKRDGANPEKSDMAVAKERNWQYQRLLDLGGNR